MFANLFKVKCLTNLHVGNGDVNFNVIDNEVEKDSVNGYPVINASGMKGALRDFFTTEKVDEAIISQIFGGKPGDGGSDSDTSAGKVKLLSAWMLARPLRATGGKRAYYLTTTPNAVAQFRSLAEKLGISNVIAEEKMPAELKNARAEDFPLEQGCYNFAGETLFRMSDENFRKINLPVIARNSTGSVNKKNLWYEEFVPHESVFYFFAVSDDGSLMNKFTEHMDGRVVQIGGNASIGYGLCSITRIRG